MANELVDVDDVTFVMESMSGLAMLFEKPSGERVWIPKSQCEWDAQSKVLTLERWVAEEKGLV